MKPIRCERRRQTRLVAAALFSIACSGGDPVDAWLGCDCPIELQRVVALGDVAVIPLAEALRNGPTVAQRNNFALQIADEFRLARRFRDTQSGVVGAASVVSDSGTFVSRRVDDMVADIQKRAAYALRGIGTPSARQQLHWAHLDNIAGSVVWRADVQSVVRLVDTDFPVTSVTVRSPVVDLPVGGSAQLAARVKGAGPVPQQVNWISPSPAVVTITSSGVATRLTPGRVLLQACALVSPSICGVTLMGTQ
jgi:hypothetical protein